MKRRNFIKGLAGVGLTASTATAFYTWQVEPFWVEFVEQKMPIKHLPKALEGKTLMQISDIHVGNRFDWKYLIQSFEQAKQLAPDFVVYTGDYVSYNSVRQVDQLKEVMQSAVRGKLVTVGILGNHDYGHGWADKKVAAQITDVLENAGIHILRNEQMTFKGLNFIGFDDYWAINFDPKTAMKQYDPNGANLVLCHNPDVCDLDVWSNYQGWILSGHTHGGQCKPPFLPPPILPVKNKRYSSGKIDLKDGRTLYINRALGHLWQVRFNVRPEITLFQMKKV